MPHLPPAHHETIKRDYPNETKIKEKQNETILDSNSNIAKSISHHNQTKELTTWFLNLSLDESIDNKSTKFDVRIQNPMKHS
jgi:outer membrane usher protein FimD/PapC